MMLTGISIVIMRKGAKMADLIERAAAIDAIYQFECCGYVEELFDKLAEALRKIPRTSTTPSNISMVYCRDCRHLVDDGGGEPEQWCNYAEEYVPLNGFCWRGERAINKRREA